MTTGAVYEMAASLSERVVHDVSVVTAPAYAPMLATTGLFPPEDGRWAFEVKWDGWRALVTVDGGLRIHTRRGRNATGDFPELAGMADALSNRRVVLDGELVAARNGALDFWAIGGRWHADKNQRSPVAFLAFDVLWLDGERVTHRPLRDRKAILSDLGLAGPAWREAPWQVGGGRDLLAACEELGLEGVVAKRLDSLYRPGARSTLWRKRKCQGWLEREAPRRLPPDVRAQLMGQGRTAGLPT